MTPDREVILLALWFGAAVGFVCGVIVTGAIVALHRWRARRWICKWERKTSGGTERIFVGRRIGKTAAELHAYRAEVALMARADAGKTANAFAAMLMARVQMRMAGGERHG